MKFVAYYTIRTNSTRVPKKSIKELGGIPLLNYSLSTLNKLGIGIILYSSEDVSEYVSPDLKYQWAKRPEYLDGDKTTFNEILDTIIDTVTTDYLVFLTCTSPFITVATINDMIDKIEHGGYDSAFTAFKHQSFCWYGNSPLNYDINNVPRTQDIVPVFIETSGLYIFPKSMYKEFGRRIGFNPYIKEVDLFEGWDIDTMKDWEIAEWILRVKDKKVKL